MREFELIIDEALTKGLGPEPKMPFNLPFMHEYLGFRCGRAGAEVHSELTNPIPPTVDMHYAWPFPQYLTGERYNFLIIRDDLANEDHVYSVSDDHATVTFMFTVDSLTFGIGTLMEVADFGLYAFMTNGVIMIYWDPALGDWHEVVASATIPMMRTVCNMKGQAIGGNIISAWHDCDETFYVWSKIGSMDFTPDEGNEAGFRRCPYGGVVYNVRRLGDSVIGYSSKGITLLAPTTVNPTSEHSAVTIGFKELSDIGMINQGAVNGNYSRQVYVGEDYALREVTAEGVKELGYQHLIELLAGEDIIVNYDPALKDFYIGNSERTFLLSPQGLSEVRQHPSAVWRRNRTTYALPATVDNVARTMTTLPLDMRYRGQKTIFSMETDVFQGTGGQAGVDWTHDTGNWNTGVFKPINNQGVAPVITSGNAFRFKLSFASLNDRANIGYVKARYKMTDMRGIRGVYAPPLRGQGV